MRNVNSGGHKGNSTVARVVDALGRHGARPRRTSSGYLALCPAHEDREPSLSIGEGDDGRALIKCHAGCETEAVLRALGMTLS